MHLFKHFTKTIPLITQRRNAQCCMFPSPPRHLICFKQWTSDMVLEIILSALSLKLRNRDTHNKRLDILANSKVMILQELNEPILSMAVSKAATLLGAYDVCVTDHVVWDHDYNGYIFSLMADVIFVTTTTHMCIQRFANMSTVPVLCMRSRTHASIQSLATIMTIMEHFGTMKCLNVAYIGAPHPVLNSYLLLCPMLGANIRFKCCCQTCPVSPLLLHTSEAMTSQSHTEIKQCKKSEEALQNANVVIAGPTPSKREKIPEFKITCQEIQCNTGCDWIFLHTCPRGEEVDDILFYNYCSRTFNAFENMQFIAAALMANAVKGYKF